MPEQHAQHIEEPRRTLILTGASRGIGHATVKRFASAGWRVITCSRHAFPENCPWAAGPEDHIQVDLADPNDTLRAVAEMRERLTDGKLHALVNNAAISPKGRAGRTALSSPVYGGGAERSEAEGGRLNTLTTGRDLWRQVFEVNFFSTIWLAQGLVAELAAGRGAIVNVTSIAGSRVHPFAGSAYATSKAALAALTREMAADMGRSASASTPSRRARLTPPSCRRARTRLLKPFPCAGWARRKKSPRRSTICARSKAPTSPAPNCTSTAGNTSDTTSFLVHHGIEAKMTGTNRARARWGRSPS
jgi:NAD(P)-dependent dehydrogenase (short-subunit alcohol dehydrogenase family)